MSQVSAPTKGTTKIPEKDAEKGLNKSTNIPDNTPPDQRSSNELPTRSPGRPPKLHVDSTNISNFIELDERFIEFRELTGATEAEALLSIIMLYRIAGRNNADTGSTANLSDEKRAKRCHWQKDPELFTKSLVKSGILNPNLTIADWLETQPHAVRHAYNTKYYQKQRLKEFKGISVNLSTEIPEMRSVSQTEQTDRKVSQIRATDSEKRLYDVDNTTDLTENTNLENVDNSPKLFNIVNHMAEILKISNESNDYTAIFSWLQTLYHNTNDVITTQVCKKFKLKFNEIKMDKPVGYLITMIKEQLQTISPQNQSNYESYPICPECDHTVFDGQCCKCEYTTENPQKKN